MLLLFQHGPGIGQHMVQGIVVLSRLGRDFALCLGLKALHSQFLLRHHVLLRLCLSLIGRPCLFYGTGGR